MQQRVLCVPVVLLLAACTRQEAAPDAAVAATATEIDALQQRVDELNARVDELVPEPAVLMAQVQVQHAKLYYAGRARNWQLAAYTLHEINEALQAVQTFHDAFEDFPTPLSELVPSLVGPPLAEIHDAIRSKDSARFDAGYQSLTMACNTCHATLDHDFIQVQVPAAREFANQKF